MERVFTLRKLPTNTTFSMFWEKEGRSTRTRLTAPVRRGEAARVLHAFIALYNAA